MLPPDLLKREFQQGLAYADYVGTATAGQRPGWDAAWERVGLTPAQRGLLAGFVRAMPVLVLSGTWCGDCVAQCPMLARAAEASPRIDLRFLDRDAHADLAERVRICGGLRVPTAIFMNEDFEFVSLLGDRTLARYRAIAAARLGAACPLPGAETPPDEAGATLQDWIDELERVQLLLRLSPRLRARHGD
jgi:thiol-disulfide isomerase/thioredoxin